MQASSSAPSTAQQSKGKTTNSGTGGLPRFPAPLIFRSLFFVCSIFMATAGIRDGAVVSIPSSLSPPSLVASSPSSILSAASTSVSSVAVAASASSSSSPSTLSTSTNNNRNPANQDVRAVKCVPQLRPGKQDRMHEGEGEQRGSGSRKVVKDREQERGWDR